MAAPDDDLEDSPEDERLAAALDDYYRRAKLGPVDKEAFLREYPELRAELEEYFEALADLQKLAPTLDHQRPAAVQPLTTIRYFGDYELLSEIARGGMGIVYRARQVSLDRQVAVKMILAGRLASEEDIARFRQEAMGAARLHHPHVVTIYEIGEHEGQQFFSMEYVDGSNLAQLLKEGTLSAQRAAEYVRVIAETMSAVHAEGLLHRDLKPSNVLLEAKTGLLRISDFGLAKSTDTETMLTTTGKVLGTPSYMSPEQASGRSHEVGASSDIYAMGAILYELATGRPPFLGETPWDTAWQVQNVEVVRPTALNPRLPRDLETICLKCLQKDPVRRYDTAQHLADDLGRFLRGEPIHARPVGRLERFWRWCRRNPALAGTGAAAVLSLIGLIISLGVFAQTQREHAETLSNALEESESRQREALLRLAESQRDKGIRLCAQGEIDQGCLWLAQSLTSAPEDADDLRHSIRINLDAWTRELCTLEAILPGEGRAPSFSRDGTRFATSGIKTKAAYVRDTATAKLLSPALPHHGINVELLFGGDPQTLLVKSGQLSLWRQAAAGEWNEQKLPDGSRTGGIRACQITKDNRVIIAESRSEGVVVTDAIANTPIAKALPSDPYHPGVIAISGEGRFAVTNPGTKRSVLTNLEKGQAVGAPLNHPSRITAAGFSHDSHILATAFTDQQTPQVQLWDTETGQKLGEPRQHSAGEHDLERIEFSAKTDRLFTLTRYSTIRIWDRQGNLVAGPLPHQGSARQFSVTDDGRLLSYVSSSHEARLWDVDAQQTRGQPLARMGTIHYVAVSPTGQHALIGVPDEARLWKIPARAPRLEHSQRRPGVLWFDFTADGRRIVSASYADPSVQVWDARSGQPIGARIEPSRGIACRANSPDGRWLAVGAMPKMGEMKDYRAIQIWDLSTGEALSEGLPQYEHLSNNLAFTPDSGRLISIGDEGRISVYDLKTKETMFGPWVHPMREYEGQLVRLAISPDSQHLAVFCQYDPTISLWDLSAGKSVCEPLQAKGSVMEIGFTRDGKRLITAGDEIGVWEANSGKRLPTRFQADSQAVALAIDGRDQLLATAHEDRTVRLWDLASGEVIGVPQELPESPVRTMFAAGGKLLITSTSQGLHLWDVAASAPVGPTLKPARYFQVSPDGMTVAASAGDEIRQWPLPQPLADDAAAITRKIEAATGKILESGRWIRPLSNDEWQQRRGNMVHE